MTDNDKYDMTIGQKAYDFKVITQNPCSGFTLYDVTVIVSIALYFAS